MAWAVTCACSQLLAAATSGVGTAVAACLLPQALALVLAVSSHLWLHKLQSCHILPLAFLPVLLVLAATTWAHTAVCKCVKLGVGVFQWRYFVSLGCPVFSLDSVSCVLLTSSEYSHSWPNQDISLRFKAWASALSPHLFQASSVSSFSPGK